MANLLPRQYHRFEHIVDYEMDTFIFRNIPKFFQYYSAFQKYGSDDTFSSLKAELGRIVHVKVDALEPTPDWFSSQVEEQLSILLQLFPSLESVCFALHMPIGDAIWAELNLESARIIGKEYLENYGSQQEEAGFLNLIPTLKLEIVEIS